MNLGGLRFAKKDQRDLTPESPVVEAIFREKGFKGPLTPAKAFDLAEWFSPLEDQDRLGACSAHAVVALFEYYDRRAFNNQYTNLSRLFLYKVTRNLMGLSGDTGADMRSAMRATHRIGICPEKYYEYDILKFDDEPKPFHYALARNQRATHYCRLDKDQNPDATLERVKAFIRAGLPSCFGFLCFESLDSVGTDGNVPYPSLSEQIVGGHAIVAAGYDDTRVIVHPVSGAQTVGAIKFPNSWGLGWGEAGWGWLPYDYVLRGRAFDFWVLLRTDATKFLDWE
jgi:C1A family cysteine protease